MILPLLPERPFCRLPRAAALAVLALLLAAMVWSALAVPAINAADEAEQADAPTNAIGDFVLYKNIAQRVEAGEPYHQAALTQQRANNYPTTPFVTVRLPTLAWGHGLIGQTGMQIVVSALMLAVIGLFGWRFFGQLHRYEVIGGVLALILGGAAVLNTLAPYSHDLVAGLLLSLALLAYSPQRWWPSLLLAALALLVRELALPFVLLWLSFAVLQRRWREAAAVLAVLLIFAAVLYSHYLAIEALRLPGDQPSPGWAGMAGPALPLLSLTKLTFLLAMPKALGAALAILPLAGWLALGGRIGPFAFLWFAGFGLFMALFARIENFYWIVMVLPAYLAGFAFVPRAIGHLLTSVRGSKES